MQRSIRLYSLLVLLALPAAAGGLGGYYAAPGAAPGWANLLRSIGLPPRAAAASGRIEIRYTSAARALAVFDREPSRLAIDGRPATLELVGESESAWTVRLPAGRHRTEVEFP